MKKIMFVMFAVLIVALAGCGKQAENAAEAKNGEVNEADSSDVVGEYFDQLDRLLVQVRSITDYDTHVSSKSLLKNVLGKISQTEAKFKALKETLGKSDDKKFVSVNTEFIELLQKVVDKHEELYEFELDWAEYASEEDQSRLEDLMVAIYSCNCGQLDCDSYKESTMEFIDSTIERLGRMKTQYGLEMLERAVQIWTKEKEVSEKHLPGLIEMSKRYGAASCYKLNDDYAEYLNELEQIEEITEDEIDSALAEKWFVPINNLSEEWDEQALEVDKFRAE
jgi:tetratricopeptide (TPR) repeat protein